MKLPHYTCTRCGHAWVPRIAEKPKQCPHCKNPNWNTPKPTKENRP